MSDDNPPYALPNGHVYGHVALAEMAAQNGGVVTCPRTRETYLLSKCSKVFVV
jgi:macrophage erythroblast attacher